MRISISSCLIVILFFLTELSAQVDSIPTQFNTDQIEDIIGNTDVEEGSFEDETVFDYLQELAGNPININEADFESLRQTRLLSDLQIQALLDYRSKTGKLLSLYEMQAIKHWNMGLVQEVYPYFSVDGGLDDFQVKFTDLLTKGRNEILARTTRVLEKQKGYIVNEETGTAPYYGNQNRYYFRYRHIYSNKLYYGVTMEKDPGEDFFTNTNPQGFDYYSAHFFVKDLTKNIRAIALGDYSISLGQGLIFYGGFGTSKGAFVTDIKRSSRTLRPYASVGESLFMRGAATTLRFNSWDFTAFASSRKKDANISSLAADTLDNEDFIAEISSLQNSGFHRTPNEIIDRGAVNETILGGVLKYRLDRGHIALNTLYTQFDAPLVRTDAPYNRFAFRGDRLLNMSLDYNYIFQNYNFYGETALSDNGGLSTTNGVLLGLSRWVDLAVNLRHFQKNYQVLNASPFAETSQGVNETGLYLGLSIHPNREWLINFYADSWKHPWLRFNVDGPSIGSEYLGRIRYKKRRNYEIYLQSRVEFKEYNTPDTEAVSDYLVQREKWQTRLHFANTISKALEVRSRLEWVHFYDGLNTRSNGFLAYQDFLYKPSTSPLHFTARIAVFQTDDYNSRIYAYENDILNTFLIPAYYNKGARYYINFRYRGLRNTTLELRWSQTYFHNQDQIGSGNEEIDGQTRSEIKFQLKYSFGKEL